MKRFLSGVFLLGFLTIITESAFSQVTISSVVFSSNANDCSNTSVTISGLHYCSNYAYLGDNVSISGSNITVTISYTVGFVCLPAIVNYSQTVNMGTLSSGTYNVTVYTYLNSSVSNTSANNSLTVTSCCGATSSFTFSADTICPGDTVAFSNGSSGQNSDEWFMDGSSLSTQQNVDVVFPDAGTYSISLVAVGDSCNDTSAHDIYVSDLPDADLGSDATICEGEAAEFSVAAGQGDYLWSDGGTGNANSLDALGSLSLTVTNDLGCAAADTVSVIAVLPAAEPDLGSDAQKCPEGSVLLNAGTGWQSILWSTGATTQTIVVSNPGIYWVEVTGANGCPGRDSVVIDDYDTDVLDINHDPDVCGETQLYTSASYSSYNWSTLEGTDTITVTESDTYAVTVVDNNGCSQSGSIEVEVFEVPEVDLGNDTVICAGQTIVLVSNVNGSYLWSTGSTLISAVITQAGTYWLEVTSDDDCAGRDTIVVDLCVGLGDVQKEVGVYPVPASDQLFVLAPAEWIGGELCLMDMEGRVVQRQRLAGMQNAVDVTGLPAGVYVLHVSGGGRNYKERVSVVK